MKNKFCDISDLDNEASVEQFFVNRLLPDLGYKDKQIKPKTSLSKLVVNQGRKKLNYRPDYAVEVKRKIRWVLDAKGVDESVDEYAGQCASYCLNLNRADKSGNPVRYFVVTNGATTKVYEWDREDSLLDLSFEDFVDGNTKYAQLRDLLCEERFSSDAGQVQPQGPTHTIHRREVEDVNADFGWCHQFIYRKDNLSQSAAFMEFVKIVFLKLLSDRDIHSRHPEFASATEIVLPAAEVRFSKRWIDEREADHPNPLDALQFQNLLSGLETEIQAGNRKRIFPSGDHINLSPDTIKGVVERLEGIDLFGIDADLNGRLFETFLNATMRGKDLGQYFTPRSVVKLGVRLARLRADRSQIDTVVDGCCGTGGFLIDALADLWGKVENNDSLTNKEREKMKYQIATERVFGVDVAKDPPLARIARMNMYLHGDGGSSIFQADALDKKIPSEKMDQPEVAREKAELRTRFNASGGFADVVLTNPPFAKEYSRKSGDEAVLDEYEIAFSDKGGARRPKPMLRSSVMFIERYHDILKPGGRLVTVIDDSILGASKYNEVRDFIRKKFIVRGVVSLPGDAFQRAKARVKTSLLLLEKKTSEDEKQPNVFMYYCTSVGVDDSPRQRVLPIDRVNRKRAQEEIERVGALFEAFLKGDSSAKRWLVPASRIADRMDVKSCLLKAGHHVAAWRKAGFTVAKLSDLVDVVDLDAPQNARRTVVTESTDEPVTHLRVRYDGFAEAGEEIFASDSNYTRLYRVRTGEIVVSHINAVHGAVGIVPAALNDTVVTNEYTICQPKKGVDSRLVWALLRSPEARAELLLLSTGIGRSRVRWSIAAELLLPVPGQGVAADAVKRLLEAEQKEAEAKQLREDVQSDLEKSLQLTSTWAEEILAAFKPPR
ncbi:MAG: N-6 DNA methylase [Actinomycetota bacterium]